MREGWKKSNLIDVCTEITDGSHFSPPTSDSEEFPYVTVRDLSEKGIDFSQCKRINKENFEVLLRNRCKPNTGDLLFSKDGTVGKVALVETNNPFVVLSSLAIIRPNKELIDSKLLKYILLHPTFLKTAVGKKTGVAIRRIILKNLKKIEISFPDSLTEQKQIVAILDKAFAAIDQAKANIERNIENAKELFQSKLNEVFSQKGDGWEEKTLGEVVDVINGYAFKSKDVVKTSSVQLLRMGNLYQNKLDLTRKPVYYPDSYTVEFDNYLVKEGDLVMSLTGTMDKTDYGYTVSIPKIDRSLLLNQRIMKISVKNKDVLDKAFLKNYLLSPSFLKRLYSTATGTRQANLSSKVVLDLIIPYPSSVSEQKELNGSLEAIKKYSEQLIEEYKRKLMNLEDLKKSILQKAFEGELTLSETVEATKEAFEKVEGISATDLQVGITALAYQKHIEADKVQYFKHVKAEKIAHLSEYILGVDMERNPVKDAAGPNDFKHAKKVESRARKAGFYTVRKQGDFYEYSAGSKFQEIINKTTAALDHRMEQLNSLLKLLIPMKTQQAEIVATLYAAWNNLLLTNEAVTDENIVQEARENWHESKLNIPREKFFKALNWMKGRDILVPKGRGKLVTAKA